MSWGESINAVQLKESARIKVLGNIKRFANYFKFCNENFKILNVCNIFKWYCFIIAYNLFITFFIKILIYLLYFYNIQL